MKLMLLFVRSLFITQIYCAFDLNITALPIFSCWHLQLVLQSSHSILFRAQQIRSSHSMESPRPRVSSRVASCPNFSDHFSVSSWMILANLSEVGSRNTSDGDAFSIHAAAHGKIIENHL